MRSPLRNFASTSRPLRLIGNAIKGDPDTLMCSLI
jgi:hypothetical protein